MTKPSIIYLASSNKHKLGELEQLAAAAKLAVAFKSADALGGMPEVEENADTFVGNALIKAKALQEATEQSAWVLADDSGLCVDALAGAPGIYSARYAGAGAGDQQNNAKLLEDLTDCEDRSAYFVCALVLIDPEGRDYLFEGRCRGKIITKSQGAGGFGYDPLFIPNTYEQTFAELGAEVKNEISHRAKALNFLADWLR